MKGRLERLLYSDCNTFITGNFSIVQCTFLSPDTHTHAASYLILLPALQTRPHTAPTQVTHVGHGGAGLSISLGQPGSQHALRK